MTSGPLRRFVREESGAAAVEFALVSVAFLTLVFGIVYLGIMLFTDLSVHWAIDRAVRLATINPSVTQATLAAEVNGYLTSLGLPTATVTYSVVSGTVPTAHINATLAHSYTVPLISTFNITYVADAYVAQGVQ
jgi:Flp pilus assembly protein TadG